MGYFFYNVLLVLASPCILALLLMKPRCRAGVFFRLGRRPSLEDSSGSSRIWVHAVSLGEVIAATPLIRRLHEQYPLTPIVVSTVTDTGRDAVMRHLAGVAEHCYLPIDFPWAVQRYIDRLRPQLFLVVETEIWPNLLRRLHRSGVPVVLVNGRLSARSFRRYSYCRRFIKEVLGCFSLCLMQSDQDAERMKALGANLSHVHRTGNMKFDQDVNHGVAAGPDPNMIGLHGHETLMIGGSTHPEEEEVLLKAYERISRMFPDVVLLLAPRHLGRVPQLEERIRRHGFTSLCRSRMTGGQDGDRLSTGRRVVILDTEGELAGMYALARIAFVGGTLASIGGHNLLEPASWGKPVFFGPFTDHCEEIARLLIQAGGGMRVRNGDELTEACLRGLQDPGWLDSMGQAAKLVVENNRGVVERNLQMIVPLVESR